MTDRPSDPLAGVDKWTIINNQIDYGADCWEWRGVKTGNGYPRLWYNGKNLQITREMFRRHFGEIPEGDYICHSCDNPSCVNPDHLFRGTPNDNIQDMVKKNRQAKGEAVHGCKLTPKKVKDIRRRYANNEGSYRTLADEYGVHHYQIYAIVNRKTWKSI